MSAPYSATDAAFDQEQLIRVEDPCGCWGSHSDQCWRRFLATKRIEDLDRGQLCAATRLLAEELGEFDSDGDPADYDRIRERYEMAKTRLQTLESELPWLNHAGRGDSV